MSKEKEPLTDEEFDRVRQAAIRKDENGSKKKFPNKRGSGEFGECEVVVLLLRYTGMHVATLVKPTQYGLRVEEGHIVWNRTKKTGKVAHTSIKINKNIEFDVQDFINDLKKRRSSCSRQYFYELVKDVGERAGVKDLSPMSFRHTFAVSLLDQGATIAFVQQCMNCSRKVLNTYLKYSKKRSKDMWEKIGW